MNKEGLPIFTGQDFPVWKMVVEQFLRAKKLAHCLSAKPEPTNKELHGQDQEALSYITRSLDFKQARLILPCKDAASAWAKLCQVHEQRSEASLLGLQRQFFNLRMERDENVAEYVSRVEYMRGQLADSGMSIAESTVVAKIISGLPPQYKSFCTQWGSATKQQQTIETLLGRLLEEQSLQASYKRPNQESVAFSADGRNSRKFDKSRDNKGNKQRGRGKKRSTKCFSCGEDGHWANKCPKKTSEPRASTSKDDKPKTTKTTLAIIAESNLTDSSRDEWIIDSGATEHMSSDRSSFVNYVELEQKRPVRVGNNAIIYGYGVGDIRVMSRLSDGRRLEITLKDVLHVPKIMRNLLSLGFTTGQGHSCQIVGNQLTLKQPDGSAIVEATKDGQLFKAHLTTLVSEAEIAVSEELRVWHERFGHINKQRLIKMAKEQSVTGLETIATASIQKNTTRCSIECQACLIGKQPRMHFGNSTQPKATGVGDRVHVDICGPIAPTTAGGSSYFVLFKDEASSYRHVYFIKNKGEAHDALRKAVAAYKGELRSAIKSLVSDRGSEFTSHKTQDFLLEQSIHQVLSAPFTPAQNGLIERDNRTVFECARSMIAARRMPHKLWGEAVQVAVYTLNRSINARSDKTPYEVVFGRKPRVSHLRVFGSWAYVKEPEKKRSGYQKKLDDRARPMLMCGYDRDFTYRLYDGERNVVVLSREVIFDESPAARPSTKPVDAAVEPERWCSDEPFSGFNDYIEDNADVSADDAQHTEDQTPDDEPEATKTADQSGDTDRDPSGGDANESINQSDQSGVTDRDPSGGDANDSINQSAYLDAPAALMPQMAEAPPQSDQSTNASYQLRPRGNTRYNFLSEALAAETEEPATVAQALDSPQAAKWREAMQNEYDSLMANKTWTLVELPKGRRPITAKWLFKIKYKADGSMDKFKARLVARGFTQQSGIDYQETFAPVVRLESVRVLIALAAQFRLEMINFDVKTAYLHGTVKEELYMTQPEGFVKAGGLVCRLHKSLYGLKQAGRCWNLCFTQFLEKFNLLPLRTDHCIFRNKQCKLGDPKVGSIIIALYVDDGLIFSNCKRLLSSVLSHLRSKFEITVDNATSYVGLQIDRLGDTISVHQSHYIERKAALLGLDQPTIVSTPLHVNARYCKAGTVGGDQEEPVDVPYRQLIGTLMYAANGTRPDAAYAVCSLSRFSESPTKSHWTAAKRVMRYLAQTTDRRITYTRNPDGLDIVCYSDADHGGDRDDRKSVSGILILCNGAPIIWRSVKQTKIANSTAVAEFVAAAQASREVTWLRNVLQELGASLVEPTPLRMDNQTAIALIANNQVHAKTKSLDIDLLTVRDLHGSELEVSYVPSEAQLADYLTKPIGPTQFGKLLDSSGLQARTSITGRSMRKVASLLMISLVLLTMTPANARVFRQPYETAIKIDHLCNFYTNAPIVQGACPASWIEFEHQGCLNQWARTHASLMHLTRCITRSKRSAPDQTEPTAPKITWASAFNFLLQQGEKVTSGTPFDVAFKTFRVITDIAFKRFITDAPERTSREAESRVIAVSETASMHANDTLASIQMTINPLESFRRRYLDEVVAANAMILALDRACRRGKVDTAVLAELAGQPELVAIDTESTSIHSITYLPAESQLSILFEATIDEPWTSTINWTFVLVAVGMVIMVSIFIGIAHYFTGQMGQVRQEAIRTYESTRRSSSVHQYTINRSHAYHTMRSFGEIGGPPAPPQLPPQQEQVPVEMTALVVGDTSPSGGVVSGGPAQSIVPTADMQLPQQRQQGYVM